MKKIFLLICDRHSHRLKEFERNTFALKFMEYTYVLYDLLGFFFFWDSALLRVN